MKSCKNGNFQLYDCIWIRTRQAFQNGTSLPKTSRALKNTGYLWPEMNAFYYWLTIPTIIAIYSILGMTTDIL